MEINKIPAAAMPVTDTQVPASLKNRSAKGTDPAAAKKVAQEFEAMFVGMMLKSMRSTVGEDKLTGGGRGEENFRSLLDQQYADAAVKSGGVGLAKQIEKELVRGERQAVPAEGKGGSHAD